ncbi:MAG: hypothetical protein M1421_07925 [Candidatus Eremiobacteraeota bacterium]|nr:hypothetical protein [Candidatus Eremiobacteraeota bacterium]MCL5055626.1 hypothetical protein [Bacillota bacterium]
MGGIANLVGSAISGVTQLAEAPLQLLSGGGSGGGGSALPGLGAVAGVAGDLFGGAGAAAGAGGAAAGIGGILSDVLPAVLAFL